MKVFPKIALFLFLLSCLFPPWLHTYDRNGDRGGHSQKPAGHYFLLAPPDTYRADEFHGVRLDFSTLLVEWLALAGMASACFIPRPNISRKAIRNAGAALVAILFAVFVFGVVKNPNQTAATSGKENPFDVAERRLAP